LSKSNIYNLKELIDALKNKTVSYAQVLEKINFKFKELEHLCFWDEESYSKISLEKEDCFELVLICWERDQYSQIHNHNNIEAWTYILKGELTEEVYTANNTVIENSTILSQKNISCLTKQSNKIHHLINSHNGRSVSLHLYVKEIKT